MGANVNGFARNYIEVAPLRRLSSNYASVNPYNPEQMEAYRTLTTQERFPAAYTVDISVGKIFYLPGRQSVNFNLSVNNLLNKKDICTGGYEQGRSDLGYPTRFWRQVLLYAGTELFPQRKLSFLTNPYNQKNYKNMKLFNRISLLLISSLVFAACERDYDAPPLNEPKYDGPAANTTIEELRAMGATVGEDAPYTIGEKSDEKPLSLPMTSREISSKKIYLQDET